MENKQKKVLEDLKIDAESVINQLVKVGCDDAWSIIKLNNMIADIDDAIEVAKCLTCHGDSEIEDVEGNIWPCPDCPSK